MNATPEPLPAQGKAQPVPGRPRRKDIEAAGGYVPMPEVVAGAHLLEYFFEFGPATKDGPVTAGEVREWGTLLGVEWEPWEARLFLRLSREYCTMQHEASKRHCPPPWPPAVKMWQWVQNHLAERKMDRDEAAIEQRMKEKAQTNGNRKRR